MLFAQTNLFNLTAPMLYHCHVHRYFSGLSRLYLRVFKGQQNQPQSQPAFYVLFSDVGYYEGAISWQGADFCLAFPDDCIALMLKVGMVGEAIVQFPDAYAALTENAKLYVVQTTHTPVRFIAGSTTLLTNLPPDLR
jgi:hypothetical protein